MDRSLALVPIYMSGEERLVERLARSLAGVFHWRVERHQPHFDPEESFDPGRGQYHSTRLLDQLRRLESYDRVLGVTCVDLFIPVLTFVFGEAQLDGPAAIVSYQRLAPQVYGLPDDPALLEERLLKESVHELGHTLGLVHCNHPRCVMRSSTYVEEIDLKDATFCRECRAISGVPVAADPGRS